MAALKLRKEVADFDLIHAWGEHALMLAALATSKKIVYSPTSIPKLNARRWLRATVGVRDVQVVCPTDTMRRRLVHTGVPIERCHLIRPGLEFSRLHKRRDEQLRAELNFAKDDIVIIPAGEHVVGADHHMGILSGTVLHVYNPRYKLLMWGRGKNTELERRFCSLMLPNRYMTFATDKFGRDFTYEKLLSAADLVLVTANAPAPTLTIAITMAASVPIVATVSRTVSELLEDRHNCLMVTQPRARLIARKSLDILEDKALQWKLSDTARTEAYEYFSMTRFGDQYRTLYAQAVEGKAVEVPPPAPGAGSRFAGRV
jgi:glycosyltransferase involved in cell wall biosynthesis